jgi:hypothetical protein
MKSAVILIFLCFWNFPIIHSKILPIDNENSDVFLCLKNLIKQWNEIELATHDIYIYNLIGENLDFVKFVPSENPLKIFNGFSKVDEPLRPASFRIIISDHQLVRNFHYFFLRTSNINIFETGFASSSSKLNILGNFIKIYFPAQLSTIYRQIH